MTTVDLYKYRGKTFRVGRDVDSIHTWAFSYRGHFSGGFTSKKAAIAAGRRYIRHGGRSTPSGALSTRRRHARENPDAALWIALGVGVVGLGVGVYFLTKSSSSSGQSGSSTGPIVLFEPGKTYQFTAALNGMSIDPTFIKNALESIGWTNVTVSSVTPGTYTATGTWSGAQVASLPPGTTATLV